MFTIHRTQRLGSALTVSAWLGVALAGIAGCQSTHTGVEASPRSDQVIVQRMVVGQSVEGRPINVEMYGRGPEVVLILAGIHGTERAGTPLLYRLGSLLRERPDLVRDRMVLLVPEANPDGCARKVRENNRGIDLNRNFPAANFTGQRRHGDRALSEPESRALRDLIAQYQPDRIVSLHQPLLCIDYDGPPEAKKLAEAMAKMCELPLKKLGGRDGSLGSWAGDTLGIPIVTVEFGRQAANMSEDELWDRYNQMLIAAIQFPARDRRATVSRTTLD